MAFRVLAPLVLLAATEVPHAYQGRILNIIPDDVQRELWLEQGLIEEIPDPLPPGVAPDPVPAAPVVPPSADQQPQRPAATATKDTWVAYIVATGAATEPEAQALTKDQLIGMAG